MSDTKSITFNRLPILVKSKVEFEDWKFSYERWCKTNKIEEEEKLECLIAITEGIARTIVINSLNKEPPDNYETTITKLKEHYKSALPKNTRLLELSTITIKKGEIIVSYYINTFRNLTCTYEALLEAEPQNMQEAMKITTKKEKIYKLVEINKTNNKTPINNKSRNSADSNNQKNNNAKYYTGNYNNFSRNNATNNNYSNNKNNYNNSTNKNYQNFNGNHINNNNDNIVKFNNINQGIKHRKNTLKYSQNTNDDIQEITKKLADLNINLCLNCKRIGHIEDNSQQQNEDQYVINAVQKRKVTTKVLDKNKISPSNKNIRKVTTKVLDKNKISPSNKNIVKPSILNQPNIRNTKQMKKAIRDTRRRKISEDQDQEMQDVQEQEKDKNMENSRNKNNTAGITINDSPEVIITDNGRQFIADTTKVMVDLYGAWIRFISPRQNPETNGLLKLLRLLGERQKEWDENLPSALWALCTSKSSVTGFSSFELLYGRKDLWPLSKKNETEEEYNFRRFLRHQKWVKEATENIQYAHA
ncbi:hypothetical protein PIROE2DRAFT_15004 [Piromyces sp. E2]|nr:hypothetical protein PIROE2DRAFT_15004 [Piromyces sp. E2]|eukprot:OUM59478.1 hypothetical protein PIROE2DRAFT_15004 [Piromyces sp. E2]